MTSKPIDTTTNCRPTTATTMLIQSILLLLQLTYYLYGYLCATYVLLMSPIANGQWREATDGQSLVMLHRIGYTHTNKHVHTHSQSTKWVATRCYRLLPAATLLVWGVPDVTRDTSKDAP